MTLDEDFELDVIFESELSHIGETMEETRNKYSRANDENEKNQEISEKILSKNKYPKRRRKLEESCEEDLSCLVDESDIDSIIEEANRLRGLKMLSGNRLKLAGSTPFLNCPFCEKLIERTELHNHMTIEHDLMPKKIETMVSCHVCEKIFANKSFLQRHIQSVHEKVIKAKCEVCDKTFTDTSNYKQHLLIHSGVKSYICQICGKGFVQPQGLRMHMPSHSDDYPFSCSLCSKKFRRKQHYELHMVKHTGKKSHQCETCGKFFSVKNELKMHSWIHKEEWPYLCLHCNKGFNQSCGLRLHMKNHHALGT